MATMDPAVRTSRVGPTVEALYWLLLAQRNAAELPHHPTTFEQPEVVLGWDPGAHFAEYIAVLTNPDETFAEWARVGPAGRDETFFVDVAVRTSLPGEFDEVAAWRRLTALTAAVEEVVWDADENKPAALDVPNLKRISRSAAVDQSLQRVDSGWTGSGLVRLAFAARV